ncbi:hypothetical protein AU106_gp268 [Sinorhizobium phage phiM9]|uniref:Thymidylate kinase n=1 Tax=Sinorhizobium phage phiM9 TaxID=1636182 RepID=A0A0F6TGS6_9CAUD|nr:hypothetical protein AU106_gp268 [Sinorhizobium phage phiM9]AKE44899.1 hypothetical protein Sm_phiM9_272 [Sinorhizobium phage phiM9]
MVKKTLLIIEGLDRSGKDSLAFDLRMFRVENIKVNDFSATGNKPYYNITRSMFKNDDATFVSDIGNAMAIVEFMQALTWIEQFPLRDRFVMTRSFVSTVIFDGIRGIKEDILSDTIVKMIDQFTNDTGIELDIRLLKLFVSKEEQVKRGSDVQSFEQIHYDRIKSSFEIYADNLIFNDVLEIDTTDRHQGEVLELTRKFLFTE